MVKVPTRGLFPRASWRFAAGLLLLASTAASVSPTSAAEALTDAERAWLEEHPVIRLAPTPDYEPTEFFEQDVYRGITADIVALVEQRLGFTFEIVRNETWAETVAELQSGDVDAVPIMARTPERDEFMVFGEPYIVYPAVILVRQGTDIGTSLDDFAGKRVALPRGYATEGWVRRDYPDVEVVPYPSPVSALRAVSIGEVDAFLSEMATAAWYMQKEGIGNLTIAGESGYVYEMGFACRRDWPELASIFQKGLALVTEQERQAIFARWVNLPEEAPFWQERAFWLTAAGIAAGLLMLALAAVAWNRQLSRLVDERTAELNRHRERLEELVAERTAQMREAMEQAHAANEAKSRFLANMSHELRTPMNAIIGYSEMLIEESEDLEQDSFIPDLRRILASGKHLLALINDVLDLSKIEAGKMELYCETFEVSDLIDEVAATVPALIEKKQNRLDIQLEGELGSMHADLTKARQVLFNLLSNAAKFTEKGTITVRARRLPRPDGERGRAGRRRHRHRHRQPDKLEMRVRGVHPGRLVDDPQLRRHRPRALPISRNDSAR